MNGKAAQLERWLEAIRQRVLVGSGVLVGQVPCDGGHDPLFDGSCYICGAAV